MSEYITGTGQKIIYVHKKELRCVVYGCTIHNPTDHVMQDFPTHFEIDAYPSRMERVCPHGIHHPDPDWLLYVEHTYGKKMRAHCAVHADCDDCCQP